MIETWKLCFVFLGNSVHPIKFSPSTTTTYIQLFCFAKIKSIANNLVKPKFSIKPTFETFGLHAKSAISVILLLSFKKRLIWGPYPSPYGEGKKCAQSAVMLFIIRYAKINYVKKRVHSTWLPIYGYEMGYYPR